MCEYVRVVPDSIVFFFSLGTFSFYPSQRKFHYLRVFVVARLKQLHCFAFLSVSVVVIGIEKMYLCMLENARNIRG